ncbi:MAG: hypothetical protein PHD91_01150 [bacterium]|jgi:hypothetical protein|nr:hypothetical protein [bacterium]MDD4558528.1 hypothetical protein [bacterium]
MKKIVIILLLPLLIVLVLANWGAHLLLALFGLRFGCMGTAFAKGDKLQIHLNRGIYLRSKFMSRESFSSWFYNQLALDLYDLGRLLGKPEWRYIKVVEIRSIILGSHFMKLGFTISNLPDTPLNLFEALMDTIFIALAGKGRLSDAWGNTRRLRVAVINADALRRKAI